MSVAWARSRERQASSPRPPGRLFAKGSRRPATSRTASTCMCNHPGCILLASASISATRSRDMTSELHPGLDRSLSDRFTTLASAARVARTTAALEANGISVLGAANAAEAKRIVLDLIPAGSQVHHGASQTLEA